MSYAINTKVSVEKSIGEIQKILKKYGADGFAYAERDAKALIMFKFKKTGIKMGVNIPSYGSDCSKMVIAKSEQAKRSKYRALLLCIKAKLESVSSGIETLEEAFLPYIVLKDGSTVGQKTIGKIEELNTTHPALLLGL